MLIEGTEAALLEKADSEEKVYNWEEAAEIYNQVAKSFLDKNMIEMAAKVYKKLGYANARAANTVDTSESYIEQTKYAINSYKKAANLFEQSGNNPEELECEAEAFKARIKRVVQGLLVGQQWHRLIYLFIVAPLMRFTRLLEGVKNIRKKLGEFLKKLEMQNTLSNR